MKFIVVSFQYSGNYSLTPSFAGFVDVKLQEIGGDVPSNDIFFVFTTPAGMTSRLCRGDVYNELYTELVSMSVSTEKTKEVIACVKASRNGGA